MSAGRYFLLILALGVVVASVAQTRSELATEQTALKAEDKEIRDSFKTVEGKVDVERRRIDALEKRIEFLEMPHTHSNLGVLRPRPDLTSCGTPTSKPCITFRKK